MALVLYGHPFSSCTQKVLVALYENATPFTWRVLDTPETFEELARLWPLRLMPVLLDGETPVAETTIILEHLDLHHRGPVRMLPDDPVAALAVRALDRFLDLYVMTPMQRLVGDALRPEGTRDPRGVAEARLARWVEQGRIKAIVDVIDGLENAPQALVGLFEGRNRGKCAVRVA